MVDRDFPGRGKVAALKTTPGSVLDDYARLMELAGYEQALPKDKETILKVNISWQTWYPACSTAPWQLEGVIRALQGAGYDVDRVSEGEQACALVRNHDYCAVLCDLLMPHISGQALYQRWLQERPALAERTIFVTGDGISSHAFLQESQRPCLYKPFHAEDLVKAVTEVLEAQE